MVRVHAGAIASMIAHVAKPKPLPLIDSPCRRMSFAPLKKAHAAAPGKVALADSPAPKDFQRMTAEPLTFRSPLSAYEKQADELLSRVNAGADDARYRFKWGHSRFK